jgi:thioredoxin reductase
MIVGSGDAGAAAAMHAISAGFASSWIDDGHVKKIQSKGFQLDCRTPLKCGEQ